MSIDCVIYRCTRQEEMYLYLREGLGTEALPPELLRRTGALQQVMRLSLTPERKLARVPAATVLRSLEAQGWFLQMPPNGQIRADLYFGD